jgi:hypothetical protein
MDEKASIVKAKTGAFSSRQILSGPILSSPLS